MKRILMVAYHFPPLAGSSGIQRTLCFAKYLPTCGWEPIILTAHSRAYENTSSDQLAAIPDEVVVARALAFDTARHFAIRGRYPGILARPDRWISWLPGATITGLAMIRRYKPHVIWSTYPIATAHRIGFALHKYSRLPWVADFRDPMAQDDYPPDPYVWKSFKRIEECVMNSASLCTFTTCGAMRMYRERYPTAAARLRTIENGYDEETFDGLTSEGEPLIPGKFTLLHSGIVYPVERDPTHLFMAIRALLNAQVIAQNKFTVRFRAPAHEELVIKLAHEHGIAECIEIAPPIPYRKALAEMLRADALLIMQAKNCNDQIPAKLYEYLRTGKPILGLTDPQGDTADALAKAGITAIAPLDQKAEIAKLVSRVLASPRLGTVPLPAVVQEASRRNRTAQLAKLLESLPDVYTGKEFS